MKEQLSQAIVDAAKQAIADGVLPEAELPQIVLEVPPQKEFGDYATNFAMQAARAFKKSPRMIAEALTERMKYSWLDRAEIAGPGFINFYLQSDWVYDLLARALREGEAYGNGAPIDEKVQIEFVSANPTGPLHVGHGRGAAFGSALVNLMRAAGYNVEAEYYINDAGNQINNLALSVDARYKELLGQPCEFPENGYHGHDIIETAQQIIDKYGDKYLAMSEEERLAAFKPLALSEKLAKLKEDLEAWGRPIMLIFASQADYDGFLARRSEFPNLPKTAAFGIDSKGQVQGDFFSGTLTKSHELPVVALTDTFNRVVFMTQGYTIGIGEQIKAALKKL